MKQFFYSIEQQQFGPVAKEELQGKITKETLVWCEGMENWTNAGDVEELADMFPNIPTPPPIPEQKKTTPPPFSKDNNQIDLSPSQPIGNAQTPQNIITINNGASTSQSSAHVRNTNNMKSKGIAYLLWLLSIFGWLGFHRFYLGKIGTGVLWILTGGLFGLGALFDLFTLGGKVDQYNTNQELNTIRAASMANLR